MGGQVNIMPESGPEHRFSQFWIYSLLSSTTLPAALCFTIFVFRQAKEHNSGVNRPATDTDLTMDEIILKNDHMRINLVWRVKEK